MGEKIRLSLKKSERLRNVRRIDQVFKNSQSIKAFPLVFAYKFLESNTENGSSPLKNPALLSRLQILYSVPKRNFKKAVDRNRIRRVCRERFRLLKLQFISSLGDKSIYGAFIYTSKEPCDYKQVDKSYHKIIKQLNENSGH